MVLVGFENSIENKILKDKYTPIKYCGTQKNPQGIWSKIT